MIGTTRAETETAMEETGITVIITVMTDGTRDAPMILVMIENVSIETESMIDVDPTTEEDDPDPQTAEGEGEEEQHITGNLAQALLFLMLTYLQRTSPQQIQDTS